MIPEDPHQLILKHIHLPIGVHPYMSIGAIAVTVVVIIEWTMTPPSTWGATLTILHILLVCLLPFLPRTASILTTVLFLITGILLPDMPMASQIWGALLALSILAYTRLLVPAIGSIAVMLLAQWSPAQIPPTEDALPIAYRLAFPILFSAAILLGCALRWRAQAQQTAIARKENELLSQRLAELETRQVLASHIHDTIAGNLTAMKLLLAIRQTDGNDIDNRLDRLITDTLREARATIGTLNGDKTATAFDGMQLSGLIRVIMQSGDRYLHDLGFTGETTLIIDDAPQGSSPELKREVNDLLRELYTNIAKHGDAQSGYTMEVHLTADVLCIHQANNVNTNTRQSDEYAHIGLLSQREHVKKLHGEINDTLVDGMWTTDIQLSVAYKADRTGSTIH